MLNAGADSYIQEDQPTWNNGTWNQLSVRGDPPSLWRALLMFDLTSITSGSSISSATLTLCVTINPSTANVGQFHSFRRITSAWAETGVTWANQPTTDAVPRFSIAAPASRGCISIDVTADVEAWMAGTPNYGWMISYEFETSLTNTQLTYGSREAPAASVPVLSITYVTP